MKKMLILALLVVGIGASLGFWYWKANAGPRSNYRVVPAEKGPFLATIAATGTVQPEEVIDVGAQVAGRIERFGLEFKEIDKRLLLAIIGGWPRNDAAAGSVSLAQILSRIPTKQIDYNSAVEDGTILAQLDPRLFQAEVDKAQANLQLAKANQLQLEANYDKADRDWKRAKDLEVRKAIAPADYDLAQAAYETAKANVEVGKATITKSIADLQSAKTNLDYTTIKSPVKGVIIDRRVNVGQTVVASLTAPSLFLIAKDLKRVQVWAQVNEADIGQITAGQEVRFTVDARPGMEFVGQVDQVRLNANMTNNVVTYTVVVTTDNSKGTLLPYLTANLQFVTHQRSDVLQVQNAALRWRPRPDQIAPELRKKIQQKPKNLNAGKEAKSKREMGTVWTVDDAGHVRPIRVQIGPSDGAMTEILGGDLHERMELVVGEEHQDNGAVDANPFTPKLFGGKKKE